MRNAITDYWCKHYVNLGHCSLCGNSGQIDTTTSAVTAVGVRVGKVNFCICPNGQELRKHSLKNKSQKDSQ